ncbi:hypothetical protein ILYODFUR_003820 [Ilyodon furcidens]|uniref:Apolipoprotein L, 1 n=1 Tax=Ilyodon furcidens TaxID=33524 RepID=A0ABV0TFT2_9TELE
MSKVFLIIYFPSLEALVVLRCPSYPNAAPRFPGETDTPLSPGPQRTALSLIVRRDVQETNQDRRPLFQSTALIDRLKYGSVEDDQQLLWKEESVSSQHPELSASRNSLTDKSSKKTSGMFGGILKRSPRPGHTCMPSQESAGKKYPKPSGLRAASKEDLSAQSELSKSNDSLSKTKESDGFSEIFKNPFVVRASSREDVSVATGLSGSSENLSENHTKEKGLFGGMFKKKVARSQSKDDLSMDEELLASNDNLTDKSSKITMVKAMSYLNPFHSATKKDAEDTETLEENRKQLEKKPDLVKSNLIQPERKEKSETPPVLRRPRAEEMKAMSLHEVEKQRRPEDREKPTREKKTKSSEAPVVPPRPSEEEMDRAVRKKDNQEQSQSGDKGNEEQSYATKDDDKHNPQSKPALSDDEGLKDEESLPKEEKKDEDKDKPEKPKVKKPKKHNPFMPQVKAASDDEGSKDKDETSSKEEIKDENKDQPEKPKVRPKQHNPFMPQFKAASDDEGLKDEEESSSKREIKEHEDKENTEKPKVKKPKKNNPFMPQVKAKVIQRNKQDGAAGQMNEEPQRSLFDQLEDFCIEPSQPKDSQDVEDLMDWWNTVESWEDTPQNDDMTEKEEAKAFALTAEKLQKGIRVFNKLFSERAESLWQHVIDLNSIADGLDKFNKKTKIAQITGGSTSAIGGVATITGLALAPVTMGTSLIVTAVGLGVATAGGLTSAGAGISNQVNNSLDRKKVEKIVEDYQEKIADLNKCLKFIKQGIENLRRFDLLKMKKHAYNQDFPALTSQFYEDGAMAGKAILINANEIMRVVQIANVAGSTAARAVQIASMATGVLTGLFVGMDIYFVAKDSKELKKGAKSEFAAKIREVSTQLHDGLVELNTIREELHSTNPENNRGSNMKERESKKDEKREKYDKCLDEDEINRIKKPIKKDIENRKCV